MGFDRESIIEEVREKELSRSFFVARGLGLQRTQA